MLKDIEQKQHDAEQIMPVAKSKGEIQDGHPNSVFILLDFKTCQVVDTGQML